MQLANIEFPISVTEEGSSTVSRLLQPKNAAASIFVTEFGISIFFNDSHL